MVVRTSLVDQVANELRRRIISGELAEGTPLRQDALAQQLGVSRIPLREAIRQLEGEGFVTSQPHKGTIVRALSLAEVRELFEIRLQLETWLLELAIPNMTEEDIRKAETIVEEAERIGDIANWGELNWRFHEALYSPSGRTIALSVLKTVHANANRYVNMKMAMTEDVHHELADHRSLIACARVKDPSKAVQLLERHIESVANNLTRSLMAQEPTHGEVKSVA